MMGGPGGERFKGAYAMAADAFRVLTRPVTDDVVMLELGGDVDVHTAPRLFDAIESALTASTRGIVINLTAVPFIDGSGIDVLRAAATRMAARKGRMMLVHSNPRLDRVLRLVGLNRVLPSCSAEDEATRAFSA